MLLQRTSDWLTQNIHPAAPWLLLTLGVFATVWLTRKFIPGLWVWFDSITPDGSIAHVVQALPSVLLGAVAGVLLQGGDIAEAWKGALSGALAPVVHLVLKNYEGGVKGYGETAGGGPPATGSPSAKAEAARP